MIFNCPCLNWIHPGFPDLHQGTRNYAQDQAPITLISLELLDIIKNQGKLTPKETNGLAESCKALNKWQRLDIAKDPKSLTAYLKHVSRAIPPQDLEKTLSLLPKEPCPTPYDFTYSDEEVYRDSIPLIAKKFPNVQVLSYEHKNYVKIGIIEEIVCDVFLGIFETIAYSIAGWVWIISFGFVSLQFSAQKIMILTDKIKRVISTVLHQNGGFNEIGVAFPNLKYLKISNNDQRWVFSNDIPFSDITLPDAEEVHISFDVRNRHFSFQEDSKVKSLTLEGCYMPETFPLQLEKLVLTRAQDFGCDLLKNIFEQSPNLRSLEMAFRFYDGGMQDKTIFFGSTSLEELTIKTTRHFSHSMIATIFANYPNLKSLNIECGEVSRRDRLTGETREFPMIPEGLIGKVVDLNSVRIFG